MYVDVWSRRVVTLFCPLRRKKRYGKLRFTAAPARRREFEPASQSSKEKTSALAQRYGLSRTTVTKWRARTTTSDAPMDPAKPKSTVLSPAEEAVIVEFRRRTLLPLDDVMGCLREAIPKLSRSSLHRCLLKHGISRLPTREIKTIGRGKFAPTEIGYVHIDIAELRLAEGKLNMFLAIDRVSKFTYVEFRDDMER
jgi:transposase